MLGRELLLRPTISSAGRELAGAAALIRFAAHPRPSARPAK